MTQKLPVISGFFKKEFVQALRDPVMRLLLLLAPVVQLTLYGYVISNEFKNIKIAAFFSPGDVVATQLVEHFYTSNWFIRPSNFGSGAAAANGVATPYDYLRSGKADAVLVMPTGGLTKALGRADPALNTGDSALSKSTLVLSRGTAQLQLLVDAQNATKARAIEAYTNTIVQQFVADRFVTAQSSPPFSFRVRVLFNPTMETAYFMVPGVMTMLICLATVLMTGISLAREKELGTFETIIAAPISNSQIILGKTIPYAVLGLVNSTLIISVGVILFGMPVRGSLFLMAVAMVVFVSTTVCVGTLISTFAHNQQQAMMGAFLFIFPAFLLSGVFFPIENMPTLISIFAYMDPLTYFVKILRNLMLKSTNPQLVWTNIGIIAVMALAALEVTVHRLRQTLN
jgi:ABC-2 type transport system permease protein